MSHHILDFFQKTFSCSSYGSASEIFGFLAEETFPKVYTFVPPLSLIYGSQLRAKCTKCVGTHKF